jgi:tRNA nucleotidyltransferase (CCA-adding enzyme)
MLLGIYEDTGSLTYTRTSVRDLYAAAHLLESGADLQIAAQFLNHPLSRQQQALFDRLLAACEHYHINGHTVLVGVGDAGEMDEEFSTIVHKLRDLLDPDALFVLIQSRGGTQFIARSTTDQIDVAQILAAFGGGGHERAAAALVKNRAPENIRVELLRLLPGFVRPAITVAQIMSRGLQVIPLDASVEEAAARMQRYGYEGYPVVGDEPDPSGGSPRRRIAGLLNRRAVDRAIAHKMKVQVRSLMQAGEVTITPGASVEELQQIMTETGWGQIPVVQPETGEIIGIVTRTDLIQTLAPRLKAERAPNLAARLEQTLNPEQMVILKVIADQAARLRTPLYIVGGFVRDLLLDLPGQDFDLVVEGDAIALAHALSRRYGGRVTGHARFGTAKWQIGAVRRELLEKAGTDLNPGPLPDPHPARLPEFIDLITARTEFYTHPTALPTVESGSIKLDLHRRDFTINTLALRLDGRHYGELLDFWGGLDDLRHGLVRALHSLSFVDDPTRMLRAVRFEQRFNFRIETRTLQLLNEAVELIERVSGDRIRHELDHLLDEPARVNSLRRLSDLGLLRAIHPALGWDAWLEQKFNLPGMIHVQTGLLPPGVDPAEARRQTGYAVWLIRLPAEIAQAICRRLKMSLEQSRVALEAGRLHADLPGLISARPSQIAARLADAPPLSLYAAGLTADSPAGQTVLRRYWNEWSRVAPTLTGQDLKRRGLPPGPAYKTILGRLKDAWLDGEIHTVEEEAALFERMLIQIVADGGVGS